MAQPGSLDPGFNGTGQHFSPTPYATELAHASALQPDGKLLVAGGGIWPPMTVTVSDGFVIRRYNHDGLLDNTFGQSGKVFSDFGDVREEIYCMAIQQDSKIVVGGVIGNNVNDSRKGILARYNSNGSLDDSFGFKGRIITNYIGAPGNEIIRSIRILSDGKILVSGSKNIRDGLLAKYQTNGQLDSSFGNSGVVQLNTFQAGTGRESAAFEVQPDGKIIIAGSNKIGGINYLELSRYLPNGLLDITYNNRGYVTTFIDNLGARAYTLKLQPDNKIVVLGNVVRPHSFITGNLAADFVVVRYLDNGLIDNSFGSNGLVFTNFYENDVPSGLVIQADGKILLCGTTYHISDQGGRFIIARYLPNGTLDNAFATAGKRIYSNNILEGWCTGVTLANQRIYLSGWANSLTNSGTGFNIYAIQNDVSPLSSVTVDLCPPNASTTLSSALPGGIYQWQLSTDSVVFSNILDNANYAGSTTATLSINNIPSSLYGHQYRCLAGTAVSNTFTLRFLNAWTGAQSSAWENSANWSCAAIPDANTDVTINGGTVFINSNITVRTLTLNTGATLNVSPGFILTVTH